MDPQPLTVVSPSDGADAAVWDLLLDSIDGGFVVPIVGRDLLAVPGEKGDRLLYDILAERLALKLGLTPEAGAPTTSPLNSVASQHILTGGDPDDIYKAVAGIMREAKGLPTPTPLRELAAIDRFQLFVTTTFDSLLQQAVADVRGDQPRVMSFSAKPRPVSVEELSPPGSPLVYHLFGRVSSLQDYVVTEEDALEFVFRLQDARNQQDHFIHQLSDKSLLMIGCSFPSWFVRFFLRLTRGKRLLFAARERAAFIVDPDATQDAGLLQFLNAFRTRTLIFTEYKPQAFVHELWRRWDERINVGGAEKPMQPGGVFVSYASEDRSYAITTAEALRARGLPAWLDLQELQPGDRWRAKIKYNIQQAFAFVPVLSQKTTDSTLRVFRYEWAEAIERNKEIASDDAFIFPVVVDAVDPNHRAIPEEIRAVQWTSLADGQLGDAFFDSVTKAIRRKKQGARR